MAKKINDDQSLPALLQQLLIAQQQTNTLLNNLVAGLTPFTLSQSPQNKIKDWWEETHNSLKKLGPRAAPTNTQLASELNTDPSALGYAAFVTAKNAVALADLLNFRRDGTTACPDNGIVGAAITIFRNDVAPKEIVQCIVTSDFNAATQIQISKLEMIFVEGVIDLTLSNNRGNLQAIFSGASSATTTALTNVAQRNGSRAEQLWGTGYTVTDRQIALAMGF